MEIKREISLNIKMLEFNHIIVLTIVMLLNITGKIQTFGQNKIFTKLDSPTMGYSLGCGWIDYNNDNKLDAYTVYTPSSCQLFSNGGGGTFQLNTEANIFPPGSYFSGLCWGDFDNDGYPDLYVTNMGGGNAFYKNSGNGHFTNITNSGVTNLKGEFLSSNWIDYDNDGYLDLWISASGDNFSAGAGTPNLLFRNDVVGLFTKITNNAIAIEKSNSNCAAFADYDNDGDMDVFMTEWGKDNWLFKNNGNGSFTKITGSAINSNDKISITASWGDYDNDGYMDLFVGNGGISTTTNVQNYLFHNNGDGTFSKITEGDIANYKGCVWTSVWGDVDNDGDLDLYAGTFFQKEDPFFINNGDGTFTQQHEFTANTDAGTSVTGACFGDYDNDGFLDLLVADNGTADHPFIYHNNGNNNKWIEVTCKGSMSNRSAIGARVKVKATIFGKSFWQIRDITGVQGFRGTNDLRAHFGLGDATIIDSLVVNWPSGRKTIQTNIPVNQFLSITEETPVNYIKPVFSVDAFKGKASLTVHFKENSIVDVNHPITSWSWDFNGDGKEDSKEKNPTYTYHNNAGGKYTVSLTLSNGVVSKAIIKDTLIEIIPKVTENRALWTKAYSSSSESEAYSAFSAIDGDISSRWSSQYSDQQWITIDLDSIFTINKVVLKWENAYGRKYDIQTAVDTSSWQTVYSETKGNGRTDTVKFSPVNARYVRMYGIKRATSYGYSLYEFEVYYDTTVTGIEEKEKQPLNFQLDQNYPNPFNPETIISYQIPATSHVELKIYDMLGREVAELVNKEQSAGKYNVKFDGSKLSSGVYFYRLNSNKQIETKKMVLLW